MKIQRAVITAAGKSQRHIPLQNVVDREGNPRAVLRLQLEELFASELDEVAVVVRPEDRALYAAACGDLGGKVTFVEQEKPLGYGHAILCASEFVGKEPFLLVVSDHVFISDEHGRTCARQLLDFAEAEGCAVSAVQATHESKLPYFGAIGGQPYRGSEDAYEVDRVLEKPTPTAAEQELVVPGLRLGHYLCFFGMHVISPKVMDYLEEAGADASVDNPLPLTPALDRLAGSEQYLALELAGRRYDLEAPYGSLMAELAVALDGDQREDVLTGIVDLLARSRSV